LKTIDLETAILQFFNPAIETAPYLQMPYLLRAKALAELGRFEEAAIDARKVTSLNSTNNRGIVAERLVQWRKKMYESHLHLLANCAMSALESGTRDIRTVNMSRNVRQIAAELRAELGPLVSGPRIDVTPPSILAVASVLASRLATSLAPTQSFATSTQSTSSSDMDIDTDTRPSRAETLRDSTTHPSLSNLLTLSDLDCNLCLNTLSDPVTCPCGHTWCKKCLLQSLEHSDKCPMCRQKLPQRGYFDARPECALLAGIMESLDLDRDLKGFESGQGEVKERVPIFICSLAFPGSQANFHMFEPRYRVYSTYSRSLLNAPWKRRNVSESFCLLNQATEACVCRTDV
jgi:Zinc finger, C3HC4 type (RING finger)